MATLCRFLRNPLISFSKTLTNSQSSRVWTGTSIKKINWIQENPLSSNAHKLQPLEYEVISKDDTKITTDTISKVNEQVKRGEEGRLFAVVHICGKQFKVTAEDIIIVEGYWPPQNGDEIKLEKVLLVGGTDFTLIGRPILPQSLVSVKATVIEKDLSHTKTVFFKRRRKQYMRINFFRSQTTMLRINEVNVIGEVNQHSDVEQYNRILD